VFDYPEDQAMYWNDREFLFGDAFLVAPVVWPGQTKRDVRLPPGDWYDYWTGEKIIGPKQVRVDAPIDKIPLFVKAGSIIPTQQIVQYSDEAPIDPLTFEIYPSVKSSTILYEDDGKTFRYQKGEYCLRRLSLKQSAHSDEVVLSEPEGTYRPPRRFVVLKLVDNLKKPGAVSVDGAIAPFESQERFATSKIGWTYDNGMKTVWIRFEDKFANQIVSIKR